MTTEYANPQVNQCGNIKVEGKEWRWIPGADPAIAASADGTIRPTFGQVTIVYDSRFGLYTPLAGTLAPVHLLVAAAWLPYPDHLSTFELTAFMHRLVVHKDGVNYHNDVENLAWADSPGEGHPALYEWLARQPRWITGADPNVTIYG
ncbi:Uncharacterised protein [Mycobacteroides abscessus subsp. abscessus]|uniref:hypothetical protein n=1 Tax=Mycobacteroides abscessus TaxID=36809 RepID=UPI00092A1ED7|nr:hypothetical protein [Mycobacteroides abscessus]SHT43684.1 Uncharacterised protein [Mycobacteroides abscessus subsp. abscessus]SLK74619.1 Uncharacterised protein [Mycobacteroides abscessus subsp. abscessus]